jgi:hypothetical protein
MQVARIEVGESAGGEVRGFRNLFSERCLWRGPRQGHRGCLLESYHENHTQARCPLSGRLRLRKLHVCGTHERRDVVGDDHDHRTRWLGQRHDDRGDDHHLSLKPRTA